MLMEHQITLSLQHWVNDGLMAVFFFLLGLELKRELLVGQLRELRRTASVLCAAVGGMVAPAGLFMTFGSADPIRTGWAIPLATDTAFALTLLVLLGRHVPTAARAFLVGLAIVDDLGAILVIALAYTSDFDVSLAVPAAGTVAGLVLLNLIGVRGGLAYVVLGVVLWLLFLAMGLHGTLAGVAVALAAPVRPAIRRREFVDVLMNRLRRFDERHDADTRTILEQPDQQAIATDIRHAAEQATAPLQRWEHRLERPVSFIIVPLFAALNAGVVLDGAAVAAAWASPLSTAILAGLLIGKPVGIVLGVWLGRLAGVADLPADLSWRHLIGARSARRHWLHHVPFHRDAQLRRGSSRAAGDREAKRGHDFAMRRAAGIRLAPLVRHVETVALGSRERLVEAPQPARGLGRCRTISRSPSSTRTARQGR